MYHNLQMVVDLSADLEVSPKQPLERVLLKQGTKLRAQVRPYVIETTEGLFEVADLYFEDGSTTRRVPFAYFSFAE
jgi:hypothetical protein